MKRKPLRVITALLSVIMLLSVIPMSTVSAIANWDTENVVFDGTSFGTNGYYNVISKKDYTLVPGAAIESEMVLNNASGTRRQVMHIMEIDPSNPDVSIIPGYYNIDKDFTVVDNQKAAGVTALVEKYENELGYNVVGAMNTALAYDCNAPYSYLVYNGEVLVDANNKINDFHSGRCATMLCVYKDAATGECSVELRTSAQGLRGDEWQAIGANFSMTVSNGELVNKSENHGGGGDDAARSMVGVKEDGTLVLVMNDGRGANNSKGFCSYELGESMLALGCKWAFNCDGGGSSSFVTKRVGETVNTLRCVPCDGAERPTLNSVLVVSNVAATGVLDEVEITADYDYFAPNTSYTFGATALDTHGYAMDMPADAAWALSDDSFGTVANGTFVSNGKTGEVAVQVLVGGAVVGSKTITVANPTTLRFTTDSTVLPYGKSTTLAFTSYIGEAEVYIDESCFDFSVDNAGGVLSGLTFTAGTNESIAKSVVTAIYKAQNIALNFTVNFGKGSEVIYNFEDGIDGWMGYDDVLDFLYGKGFVNEKSYIALDHHYNGSGSDNFSESVVTRTFLATAENGYVHSGNQALGIEFDFTQSVFNEWCYGVLFNTTGGVLRDVANNKKATTLGMWMRMPENFVQDAGMWANQLTVLKGTDKDHLTGTQVHFYYKGKTINNLTEADIPENRWIYVTATLPTDNYVRLSDPNSSYYRSPSFLRTYIKPNVATKFVWYIDDITLDYSSAVDDRVPPVISNPQYATADTNIAFNNGAVIDTISAGFTAYISDDNSGVDVSTAQIYVDGNKVMTKVTGNMMFSDAIAMGTGKHLVKFEVADKLGNYTTLTRLIESKYQKVSSSGVKSDWRNHVWLEGRNDSGQLPMPGSVYYIDVKSNKSEQKTNNGKVTLVLNAANEWILDQITVGENYDVTYEVNDANPNEVTFTYSCSKAKDKATMFTVPVAVYNPVFNSVEDNAAISGRNFTAAFSVKAYANVHEGYGNYDEFVIAEFNGNRTIVRHEHTAVAIPDKAVTATEAGYKNRTYCDVCQSVVDFGETIIHRHNYELVDAQFVCDCGDVYDAGTGIFELNGKLYYAINGELKTGWQTADDGYCYASAINYEVATGTKTLNGVTYTFGDDGILAHGEWIVTDKGTKYSYGPDCYQRMWVEIDGASYYFGRDAYMYTGVRFVKNSPDTPAVWYDFGTDGATDKNIHPTDGLYELNGDYYVVKNGETFTDGIACVDGNYYYGGVGSGFDRFGCVAKDTTMRVATATANGLITPGVYHFGADGKMDIYHGVVGDYFYDENGCMVAAYNLVNYNGDYYFVNDGGKIAKDKVLYLSDKFLTGTSLLPGNYTFGADGKMVVKNGADADGYFYIDGVKQKAYQLVSFNGDYYFINDYNKYAVDKTIYLSDKFLGNTNFAPGYFIFGSDGKMVVKNGADADGYFYIDGVKQKAYQLVSFNGDYYFINDYNKYAVNKTIYLSDKFLGGTNLLPGNYIFGADGKMVIKNGADADGYFYIDGVKQKAYQLVKFDGNYYFINDYNKYAVNKTIYLSDKFLGGTNLLPGNYTFDENGKMIIKNGADADGYFYIDGVKQKAYQLVEFNGDYYFINDYNRYAVNKTIYLSDKFVEGTGFTRGYFTFGADGKMITE